MVTKVPFHANHIYSRDLKRRQEETVAKFPAIIIYNSNDMATRRAPLKNIYQRLVVRLDHLQNLFFIERLLSKIKGEPTADLVKISLEIVSLTLLPWMHRELMSGTMCDGDWMVMAYGAPAGGVLCMELLRPSPATSSHPVTVTKSTMIQHLSMLTGFLDSISPQAPNGPMCATVKKIVKQVLDRVLDPPVDMASQEFSLEGWEMDFSAESNDLFNFDLLDTFDWLRPDTVS
jgi:hypothetical protein